MSLSLIFNELFSNYFSTILISIVLLFIILNDFLHINVKKFNKLRPPGPSGLPIVGYLPFLSKYAHEDFVRLSEKYGPVFSLRLGGQDVVV